MHLATRILLRRSLIAVALTWPSACTHSQAPESRAISERRVAPARANPAITQWTADHYVWAGTRVANASQIMLLLPGSNGSPSNFRLIGAIAAQQGYRSIGLMYPDDRAVVAECSGDADAECMALMRSEIIEGSAKSPHVDVDYTNSIDGRLADLLKHLAQTSPQENWQSFLTTAGTPKWEKIAVGGLSQGGGHAAYVAKLRAVPRVVMFGAPADGYSGGIAPWMQLGATPSSRYFGFRHARDPFLSIQPNWFALGMGDFGVVKNVDGDTRMFDGSHMLVTDLLPATGSYANAHPSVFGDAPTPRRADGSPVFDAAWRYLLGSPAP